MSSKIQVTDMHREHYIRLEAADANTAVWFDGFTGLQIVVSHLGLGLSGAVGAGYLVSVIDRGCKQTFAWAFHDDSSVVYIKGKIPEKTMHKVWKERLAASIRLALQLHAQVEEVHGAAPAAAGSHV